MKTLIGAILLVATQASALTLGQASDMADKRHISGSDRTLVNAIECVKYETNCPKTAQGKRDIFWLIVGKIQKTTDEPEASPNELEVAKSLLKHASAFAAQNDIQTKN